MKGFEHNKQIKLREGEMKDRQRQEIKEKVDYEFSQKIDKVSEKLARIDKRARELKEKKERERLINIELDAIKRREREEEAQRLQKVKAYNRKIAASEIEKKHMRTTYLLAKRQEVKELRKTVKLNSQMYKDKVKEEVSNLKRKRMLSPDNIHIDLDPNSVDRMTITHDQGTIIV